MSMIGLQVVLVVISGLLLSHGFVFVQGDDVVCLSQQGNGPVCQCTAGLPALPPKLSLCDLFTTSTSPMTTTTDNNMITPMTTTTDNNMITPMVTTMDNNMTTMTTLMNTTMTSPNDTDSTTPMTTTTDNNTTTPMNTTTDNNMTTLMTTTMTTCGETATLTTTTMGNNTVPSTTVGPVTCQDFTISAIASDLNPLINATIPEECVAQLTSRMYQVTSQNMGISDPCGFVKLLQHVVARNVSTSEVTSHVAGIIDDLLGMYADLFADCSCDDVVATLSDLLDMQTKAYKTYGEGKDVCYNGVSVVLCVFEVPVSNEELTFTIKNGQVVCYDNAAVSNCSVDTAVTFNFDSSIQGTAIVTVALINPPGVSSECSGVGTDLVIADAGPHVDTVHIKNSNNQISSNQTCVYWDSASKTWSPEGCKSNLGLVTNITTCTTCTTCTCNHTGSFAVLLSEPTSPTVCKPTSPTVCKPGVPGILGSVIAIFCLIITIATYLFTREFFNSQRILLCLCFALLLLYLAFAAGIGRIVPSGGCVVVGVVIHFCLLASLMWMMTEMVSILAATMNATIEHFFLIASLISWGVPGLVCLCTVASDSALYRGDGTYCFFGPGPALNFAVIFLVTLLLGVTISLLIAVFVKLIRPNPVDDGTMIPKKTLQVAHRLEIILRLENVIVALVFYFLAWVVAFIAVGPCRMPWFDILFFLFASTQGLGLIITACLRQKAIRELWAGWLRSWSKRCCAGSACHSGEAGYFAGSWERMRRGSRVSCAPFTEGEEQGADDLARADRRGDDKRKKVGDDGMYLRPMQSWQLDVEAKRKDGSSKNL